MSQYPELAWIASARKDIGTKEIKGAKHNSKIIGWLKDLKAWWAEDETPWCGTFVAKCLKDADLIIPKHWYRAVDYLNLPNKLDRPAYGCIVIFTRTGGGHVGFVVGKDKHGNIMVLGGNQSDQVKISAFSPDRVTGYRWPSIAPAAHRFDLPVLASNGSLSTNEA